MDNWIGFILDMDNYFFFISYEFNIGKNVRLHLK